MNGSNTLRQSLRTLTDAAHAALDAAMATWACGDDYPAFLSVQFAARKPIEQWLARHAPHDWVPPGQTHLIAQDLATLGMPEPLPASPLALPQEAYPGVAWAIAGSSLGNRAMLQRRLKAGRGEACAFLSDPAMPAFWRRLLPQLETPAGDLGGDGAAVVGARAVFALFQAQAAMHTKRLAA